MGHNGTLKVAQTIRALSDSGSVAGGGASPSRVHVLKRQRFRKGLPVVDGDPRQELLELDTAVLLGAQSSPDAVHSLVVKRVRIQNTQDFGELLLAQATIAAELDLTQDLEHSLYDEVLRATELFCIGHGSLYGQLRFTFVLLARGHDGRLDLAAHDVGEEVADDAGLEILVRLHLFPALGSESSLWHFVQDLRHEVSARVVGVLPREAQWILQN
mmetsp:Transcript_123179/g.394536  ORF Transcript_123179/g.394536 Transcript_123179/m.394536 type:complete len:215 (+) Transcript_123179:302-946(+)